MKGKGEEKVLVFGVGVKGDRKGLGLGFFCEMVMGRGVMVGLGDRRGLMSKLGYFGGDILVEGCRMY